MDLTTKSLEGFEEESLTDPVILENYRRKADVIKSLAHPTRLFIAVILEKGPLCVCEITARVGSDMSTISRHLSVMKNAGIISDERRGNQIWYSLVCPCVLGFLGCVDAVLEKSRSIVH